MFMYYKHCDQDRKVKDPSKENEYNISVYLRMIYFFSYFAIYSPYVGEKLNTLPLGYGVKVILPIN
jgi:hypothetical protein